MERVVFVCGSFEEAEALDRQQWMELSGDERVAIGEQMREEAWGDVEPGLQRVLRVAEHARD